jgi:hypothetical protein
VVFEKKMRSQSDIMKTPLEISKNYFEGESYRFAGIALDG